MVETLLPAILAKMTGIHDKLLETSENKDRLDIIKEIASPLLMSIGSLETFITLFKPNNSNVASTTWPSKQAYPGRSSSAPVLPAKGKSNMVKLFEPPTEKIVLTEESLEERRIHNKDSTIVIVGVAEKMDEQLKSDVEKLLGDSKNYLKDVVRVGREENGRSRVVKVKLNSSKKEVKDVVKMKLRGFGRFTRDDYSLQERTHDRALRDWCSRANAAVGFRAYIVIDLQLQMTYSAKFSQTHDISKFIVAGPDGAETA